MPQGVHDSSFRFMERLAEEGFGYAGAYLEQACRCTVLIIGPDGELLYPAAADESSSADEAIRTPPQAAGEAPYSYDADRKQLAYFIPLGRKEARIVLAPIETARLDTIVSILEEVSAPLTYHLAGYLSSQRMIRSMKDDASAKLFEDGARGLSDYLAARKLPVDESGSYFVTITRIGGSSQRYDWAATSESVRQYLREQHAADVIDIGIDEGFLHIFPSDYAVDDEGRKLPHRHFYDLAYHKAVHDRYNGIVTSIGIGRSYPFHDLGKSLREAKDALELGWLLGKDDDIIRYSHLGIFAILLDTDRETLKEHCRQALKPVVDFEAAQGTPLMNTLRLMLDHSFRWTDVSKLLFIHVNTLRYRMDKIAELLDSDFSEQAVRANYFITVKLYDLLNSEQRGA
ncbi:PucR family transcriptional regulator [Raoultibacter phocaeensis]|uniref:PucR family transcriptional regulator n=1 Tax=Raoultibacter phocaeensis TaxID=2479841 RepID=UPI00111B8327|nr:helix-turn-helix domain-containing protein [Raoultibacter phocaeensis]